MTMFRITGRKPDLRLFEAPNEGTAGADAAARAASDAALAQVAADAAAAKLIADAAAKAEADAAKADPRDIELAALRKEKADLLRETMDKKSKIADAKTQLDAFKGADPVKVAELLAREKEAEQKALSDKGEFETLKKMMADEHERSVKELNEKIAAQTEDLAKRAKTIDGLTLGRSFSDSKFIGENVSLTPNKVRTLYGAHFEMKDGAVVAYDKPAGEASRVMMVDASGNPLNFETAIERIINSDPDKSTVIKSKIVPGGGSSTTDVSAKAKESTVKSGVTGVARIAAALAKDNL